MGTDGNQENKEISRRQFLTYVVAGGAVIIAAAIATPVVGYFLSPAWKQQSTKTVPVAKTGDIPIGTPTFVRIEQRVPDAWLITLQSSGVWIVTQDGKSFTVFDPHCTHLRCPYYWDENQGKFLCPCHAGVFDIEGKVLSGPPPRPLDRLEYIIQQGQIELTGNIIKG